MRAAHAAVLREADPAVRGELARFELTDGRFNQPAEFLALLFRDRGLQVLDFGQLLSHEDDEGHIGNAADPGIADELRIEREKPFGLFRIPAGRGLPIDQAMLAIEFTDRIDIGNELIASREGSSELELQVLLRIRDNEPAPPANFSSR